MLATNTLQFQHETRSSIQNLEKQVSQLATSIGKLEAQSSGKFPSQTIINPRENVSAISLRSGREIEVPIGDQVEEQKDKVNHEEAKKKNQLIKSYNLNPIPIFLLIVFLYPSLTG